MSTAFDRVYSATLARHNAIRSRMSVADTKVASPFDFPSSGAGFNELFDPASRRNQERYAQYRGWLFSAINAIAYEAAGQPVFVGKLHGSQQLSSEERSLARTKAQRYLKKMPKQMQIKAAQQEWEVMPAHPFALFMEEPNVIQKRWQFVYSFVVNLLLTGWSYVVGGAKPDGGFELYSLPTTWIKPLHKNGPFSEFLVGDPSVPESQWAQLPRENVAFAHLPNPADPRGALAPATSQITAIRIDDHIQTSQVRFFENGIFPSVVVTVGKDPHPDVPGGGIRPRLNGEQRRQVISAIRKVMSGPQNSGAPAIVDGLIEKIDRLSATSTEMGWDKSEDKVKMRLLSAFCVHPYILGEAVPVGGEAQANVIQDRFFKRVNTILDMLSGVITAFAPSFSTDMDSSTYVWWEQCVVTNEILRFRNLIEARKLNDISKNEFRAELGFAPDEDDGIRGQLLDHSTSISAFVQIATAVTNGLLDYEGTVFALTKFFKISEEEARLMLGAELERPEPIQVRPNQPQLQPPAEEEQQPTAESETVEEPVQES